MIKFYFHPSPNPLKIALYLEETGEPYDLIPVDTRKGEQHSDAFKAINPNAKTPAMLDDDVRVFDSNAMLLYLAEKIGKFVPVDTPKNKAEMYSWLMFVATGIGPYCGQAVHFKHFAPKPNDYAVNRYDFEAWRHWHLINDHLANQPYMMGNEYTIVDMSVWGWARVAPFVLGADAWEKLPHVKRLLDEINARPAAQRAEALKTKFAFKTEVDERQAAPMQKRVAPLALAARAASKTSSSGSSFSALRPVSKWADCGQYLQSSSQPPVLMDSSEES